MTIYRLFFTYPSPSQWSWVKKKWLEKWESRDKFYRRMLPEAVDLYHQLVEEYPNQSTLLPKMSNQKMNEYIKVIANLAGIDKRVSCHTARHTYATSVLLENGADIKLVSHLLGHRSITVTESIYARYTRLAENRGIDKFLDGIKAEVKSTFGPSAIQDLTTTFTLN